MIDLAAVVAPRADLVVEEFDDAVLVWDVAAARLHHLDAMAALVWHELRACRPLSAITKDLAREFDEAESAVGHDLLVLVGQLQSEGLLVVA